MIDLKNTKKVQIKSFSKVQKKPFGKSFGKQGNLKKKSKNIYWEQGLEASRLRKEYYKNFEKNKNKRHKKKKACSIYFI